MQLYIYICNTHEVTVVNTCENARLHAYFQK